MWCRQNIAFNSPIAETKNKTMKATNLGLWYVQIPYNFVINPQGEVVEPKVHNGSVFVWIERKRVPISKLPKVEYNEAMRFKRIFCE